MISSEDILGNKFIIAFEIFNEIFEDMGLVCLEVELQEHVMCYDNC